MRWATRRHCHVDRAACAWLIRRFVDPDAEFVFVDDPDEVPADATPFDIRGAELSHHGGECSFEAFLRRFDLEIISRYFPEYADTMKARLGAEGP